MGRVQKQPEIKSGIEVRMGMRIEMEMLVDNLEMTKGQFVFRCCVLHLGSSSRPG